MRTNLAFRRLSAASNFIILSLVLAAASGCKVESQKPGDSFDDGKFPAALERLANQKHEIANVKGLLQRVLADQADPNLLPIAVIDLGVDLAHPDLAQRIAFDVENGKIVGAGYDFMGEDRWASPVLVNPTLYAFGAKGLRNGKIVGPVDHPLDLMVKLNTAFMDRLIKRINKDPVLKKSLFTKITKDSMSVFGAFSLVKSYAPGEFNGDYTATAEQKALISPSAHSHALPERFRSNWQAALIHTVVDEPWVMDESGAPDWSSSGWKFSMIENADRFITVLQEETESFGKESGFDAAYSPYAEYNRLRRPRDENNERRGIRKNLSALAAALRIKIYGPRVLDPLHELGQKLQQSMAVNEAFVGPKGKPPEFTIDQKDVPARLVDSLARIERSIVAFDAIPSKTEAELAQLEKVKPRLGAVREMIKWFAEERELDRKSFLADNAQTPQASLYRRHLFHTGHPMISSGSKDANHGSHVSGIIAAQDPAIRIVPVRVSTQGMDQSPFEGAKLLASFKSDFATWLENPVVLKALGAKIGSSVEGIDFNASSESARKTSASAIVRLLEPKINAEFEDDSLEFIFMNEVMRAIRYVGEHKIKLANISLGTSFDDQPKTFRATEAKAKLSELSKFLTYEFFKFQIGSAVEKYAQKTLFVVASGNDGKWIDGESRSGLPVDISSPFIAEFEKPEAGWTMPNNHVKNVLAVGSLNPRQELSSFSNIPIGLKTPFILAEGESILSPVRSVDMESITQLIEKIMPELSKIGSMDMGDDDRMSRFIESERIRLGVPVNPADTENKQIKILLANDFKILDTAVEAATLHMFLKYPNMRARMSGTSMATPAVVGILGHLVIEKAKRLGVKPSEIGDHPEFTPDVLISDLFKISQAYKAGIRGLDLRKVTSNLKWDATSGEKDVETLMNGFIEKGKQDNHLSSGVREQSPAIAVKAKTDTTDNAVETGAGERCEELFKPTARRASIRKKAKK